MIQFYDSTRKIDALSIMKTNNISISTKSAKDLGKLFAGISNKEFEKLGVKSDKELKTIRSIK